MDSASDPRWNHNLHYQGVILDALPASARSALDVGCGDGLLVRELAARVARVVGIDLDGPSLARARDELAGIDAARVELVRDDVMTHPFEPASFDVVASVATLHHLDARAGLIRMRELLAPGGLLGIVGLAAVASPADAARSLAGALANRPYQLLTRRRHWEHAAPTVWPPPESYRAMRRIVDELLPGAVFRAHLFWRYTVLWTKPPR
ncbi:bifunctional 2-polyprenyl-6-hydroxyphenol methylase/3-demethylubiquinol 3-O-methyltransferase UbiG [Protaetiibacter sp. SSC-01]|uniref:class I SAM-dependent methyltransferase n=1 Tax=Protaetiibacter sp. SSC-01 TaxID=2759943 RepID=UPI00223B77AF|nr:class I SAM-dependent methyltransferase [Protaetiibacter sp. SSC-01]